MDRSTISKTETRFIDMLILQKKLICKRSFPFANVWVNIYKQNITFWLNDVPKSHPFAISHINRLSFPYIINW